MSQNSESESFSNVAEGSVPANPELLHSYRAKETVNGVQIELYFDPDYNKYVIYFPQIVVGQHNTPDQLITISQNEDEARTTFEYAKQMAKDGFGTPYNVYHLVLKHLISSDEHLV